MRGLENSSLPVLLLLFCLLVSVNFIFYNGVAISDDEQLFISVAQNLSSRGELNAPQLYGNSRLGGIFHGIGPFHPLLASLLDKAIVASDLGRVQAFFLISPVLVAFTGLAIFTLVNYQGYPTKTALVIVFMFAFGTIVWPYSKTFFREPLAMLLITTAWLLCEWATSKSDSLIKNLLLWFLLIAIFLALLLTKIFLVVSLPAFALLVWARRSNLLGLYARLNIFWIAALGLFMILWVLTTMMFLDKLPAGITGRLSNSFIGFVWNRLTTYPHDAPGQMLAGSLISPGKGLLVYSPGLVLAPLAFVTAWRRNWKQLIIPWTTFTGLVLAQFLAYNDRWWGVTWGSRFLLPVVPLLLVASAPVIHPMVDSGILWKKFSLLILIGLGLVIQLGGVLIADPTYLAELYSKFDSVYPDPIIWNPRYTPVIGHWKMALTGTPPDLAIWRVFPTNPAIVIILLGLIISLIASSGWLLFRRLKYGNSMSDSFLSVSLTVITLTLLPYLMLEAFKADPRYFADRLDYGEATEWIEENGDSGDVIVVRSYLDPIWYYFSNSYHSSLPWYSLSQSARNKEFSSELEPRTLSLLNDMHKKYERVIILSEDESVKDEVTPEEIYLNRHAILLDRLEFSGKRSYEKTVVALYAFP